MNAAKYEGLGSACFVSSGGVVEGRYRQVLKVHSPCLPWKALEWALLLLLVE